MAEKNLILKCSIIHNGQEIGVGEVSMTDEILGLIRERNFNLEHSFGKPILKAIDEATKSYDVTVKKNV